MQASASNGRMERKRISITGLRPLESIRSFLNAILPRYPSACGVCLERGRPQLFRVSKRFFEILGVEAPLVTDGLLLPWQVDGTRGTIFIMAHEREQAFDLDDVRMMQMLADFAAMGFRHQRQQKKLIEQERASAAAAMANQLAHQINNPLQSLTNVVYLAAQGAGRFRRENARQLIGCGCRKAFRPGQSTSASSHQRPPTLILSTPGTSWPWAATRASRGSCDPPIRIVHAVCPCCAGRVAKRSFFSQQKSHSPVARTVRMWLYFQGSVLLAR